MPDFVTFILIPGLTGCDALMALIFLPMAFMGTIYSRGERIIGGAFGVFFALMFVPMCLATVQAFQLANAI